MHRRLTTILAADVVGYGRLASLDEEGTVSRLRALRQELVDPPPPPNGAGIAKPRDPTRGFSFEGPRWTVAAMRQCS
jgi:adenylate cyclase